MGLYEKIKILAEQQKISIRKLEESLGYGNGTIRRWDKQIPGVDKLSKVADYFNVSVDYLLGRDISEQQQRELTIQEALDSVMSYDGEPLTDNDREVLKRITEAYLDGKL